MSITKQVTVWCDGQYDGHSCVEWEQYSGNTASVRTTLKKTGWTFKAGKDFCKRCSGVAVVAYAHHPLGPMVKK